MNNIQHPKNLSLSNPFQALDAHSETESDDNSIEIPQKKRRAKRGKNKKPTTPHHSTPKTHPLAHRTYTKPKENKNDYLLQQESAQTAQLESNQSPKEQEKAKETAKPEQTPSITQETIKDKPEKPSIPTKPPRVSRRFDNTERMKPIQHLKDAYMKSDHYAGYAVAYKNRTIVVFDKYTNLQFSSPGYYEIRKNLHVTIKNASKNEFLFIFPCAKPNPNHWSPAELGHMYSLFWQLAPYEDVFCPSFPVNHYFFILNIKTNEQPKAYICEDSSELFLPALFERAASSESRTDIINVKLKNGETWQWQNEEFVRKVE